MEIQSSQMSLQMQHSSMSASAGTGAASVKSQKEGLGAELIVKTMGKMNDSKSGSTGSDYQFQKDVLSAAATGKGSIINIIA